MRRSAATFRVTFAGSPGEREESFVSLEARWLAGAAAEELFHDVTPILSEPGVRLFRAGRLLLGHAHEPFVARELTARTEVLYRRMLAACGNRHLFRIWNYVPRINTLTDGFENYRAFCRGRAQAFEATHGGKFEARLPAASAVGSQGERLDVIFVAGETPPRHLENPEQVPAYHYPAEHGPRAPSFARATVAQDGDRRLTFISGTSAIKGHQTIAPDELEGQIDCTLDNLRLISCASGLGDDLGASREARRHFKIYLRHPRDLAATRARLERTLLRPVDTAIYLHAEVCREALNIEIEASIVE